jgi:membrane protease YdiL (CAAX protease family)
MISSFSNWVQRFPLVAYFVLVFGIEWLLVFALVSLIPPMVALLIGSWLPNVVGVLITWVAGGQPALRELASKVGLWRIPVGWYAAAFLFPPMLTFLAIGLYTLLGNTGVEFSATDQLLTIILICLFTGALGEELGWRGTALPRLQAHWNPLISSLILGVLWGLYHLPSFLVRGLPLQEAPLIPFMLGALGLTILVTWTFNHTRGSLVPVFLYHFAFNFMLNITGMLGNAKLFWLLGSICMIAAVVVVIMDWSSFARLLASSDENTWVVQDHRRLFKD